MEILETISLAIICIKKSSLKLSLITNNYYYEIGIVIQNNLIAGKTDLSIK